MPFSAYTRMSGVDMADGTKIRKGAPDSVLAWVREPGGNPSAELSPHVERIARSGGTPLLLARNTLVLGVIYLKDILKPNMRERFDRLRAMGIRTVMITGDNPLTAATIAKEAGVDDFLAEATPETKMDLIKREQTSGRLVAMTGDGTNDAPALAQADVGVAMNSGTQAAKEAGNMVDLDSDPTKLIEIVEIGKQLLMTRGALTTFSIANDVAKYFAILPAMFAIAYKPMELLNVMRLATPQSAILSAVIFNALIIIALIPLALRGVKYVPKGANAVLFENVMLYGVGGIIIPFVGIKAHRHDPYCPSFDVEVLMLRYFGTSLRMTIVSIVLLGLIYPLAMTGIAQVLFPKQANGSLVVVNGKVVGSWIIGQLWTKPQYFQGRPSAAGKGYDPTSTGGTNLGPTSAKLLKATKATIAQLEKTIRTQTERRRSIS